MPRSVRDDFSKTPRSTYMSIGYVLHICLEFLRQTEKRQAALTNQPTNHIYVRTCVVRALTN